MQPDDDDLDIDRELKDLDKAARAEGRSDQGVSYLAGLRRALEWLRDGRKGPLWDGRTYCGW